MDAKVERLMMYQRGFKRGAANGSRDGQANEDFQRGYEDGRRAFDSAIEEEQGRLSIPSTRRLHAVGDSR